MTPRARAREKQARSHWNTRLDQNIFVRPLFFLLAAFKPGEEKKRRGVFSINSEMIDPPDAEITEWEGSVWGNDGLKRCEQNREQCGFFLC